MNIHPVRDNSEGRAEKTTGRMRHWREVHVGADNVPGPVSRCRGECRRHERQSAWNKRMPHAAPQWKAAPHARLVGFAEQAKLVAQIVECRAHFTAEGRDSAPEARERGRPEMNLQSDGRCCLAATIGRRGTKAGWIVLPAGGSGRSTGFGHRSHAHFHPNPAASAAPAPPDNSMIDPFG